MKQYGFYFDSAKCSGCKTCMVSCKDEKDLASGIKFRRVYEYGGGDWAMNNGCWEQNIFAYYVSVSCNHCSNPPCVKSCPVKALKKRAEDGLVVIDEKTCIGCRTCEKRCPYGAPQFNVAKKKMSKCDGCYERVSQGLKPSCVESCPQRALDFGLIEVLKEKYGNGENIAPLPDPSFTSPNILINPHRDAKPFSDKTGSIQNSVEV